MSTDLIPAKHGIHLDHAVLENPFVYGFWTHVAEPGIKFLLGCLQVLLGLPMRAKRALSSAYTYLFIMFAGLLYIAFALILLSSQITGYNGSSLVVTVVFFPIYQNWYWNYSETPRMLELPTSMTLRQAYNRMNILENAMIEMHATMREQSAIISDLVAHQSWGELTKADFALYTAGAKIIDDLTTRSREDPDLEDIKVVEGMWPFVGGSIELPAVYPWPSGAAMALHYDTQPGYCWPFEGSRGSLGVMLARRIIVEEVTIDHVAGHLAWDRSLAPRYMELWGLVDLPDDREAASRWKSVRLEGAGKSTGEGDPLPSEFQQMFQDKMFMRLASFEYDLEVEDASQTFAVDDDVRNLAVAFRTVVLLIYDNWGASYTCIYRLRVHGSLPGGLDDAAVPP